METSWIELWGVERLGYLVDRRGTHQGIPLFGKWRGDWLGSYTNAGILVFYEQIESSPVWPKIGVSMKSVAEEGVHSEAFAADLQGGISTIFNRWKSTPEVLPLLKNVKRIRI